VEFIGSGCGNDQLYGFGERCGAGANDDSGFIRAINGSTILSVTAGFLLTDSLNLPRFAHTATMQNNGTVLIAGGDGSNGSSASAELY
jgi:hypothetical protein